MDPALNFCSACGSPVRLCVPAGDNLPRHVCAHCGAIHYRNPRLVVGAVPAIDDRVLLCRRAIEPRYGFWTLPAGFMENGESLTAAALRETVEEAGAHIIIGALMCLISVPQINQVHAFFGAKLLDLEFSAGIETLEIALFAERDLPWHELAFGTVSLTLRHYFADRVRGHQGLHVEEIT